MSDRKREERRERREITEEQIIEERSKDRSETQRQRVIIHCKQRL
jgi:hypothetical protein